MATRKVISIEIYRVKEVIDDMLRYDTAFACEKFPGIVAYPRFRAGNNRWGGNPTVERWRSFLAGFDPKPITPGELRDVGIMDTTVELMCEDDWYTITNAYERISLRDYIAAGNKARFI